MWDSLQNCVDFTFCSGPALLQLNLEEGQIEPHSQPLKDANIDLKSNVGIPLPQNFV